MQGIGEGEEGERTPAESMLSAKLDIDPNSKILRPLLELKPRVGHPTNCATQAPRGLYHSKVFIYKLTLAGLDSHRSIN